ncbi:MAG: DUF2059 domain-containing protein [Proteobacteria bacterium]|nr:MAG: DUF2059 domain-containing protein [Pseudomonadota bacterium]
MKSVVIAVCLFLTSVCVASTDRPVNVRSEKDATAAVAFVKLLGVGESFDEAIQSLKAQQARQFRVMSMISGGDSTEMLEGYSKQVSELIANAFDKDAIVKSYVDAYAASFTTDELATLTSFLSTPEGDKFLKQSDRIEMEVTRSLQPKLDELRESILYLQEDMMAMLKHSADPNSPMAKLQALLQDKMMEQAATSRPNEPAGQKTEGAATQ